MTQTGKNDTVDGTASDRGVTIVFIGAALIAVIGSANAVISGQPLEAHVWPLAAGSITALISGALLITGRAGEHRCASRTRRVPARALVLFSIASVAYVWAVDMLGFVLATIIFCVFAQRIVQPVSWLPLIRNSLAFSFVIVLLFILLMGVATPIGREPFTEIHAFLSQMRYQYF